MKTPELLQLQGRAKNHYGLRVAWPPIGLQRPTAFKDLSLSLKLMRQGKFSLRITSYQSQASIQSRGYQASNLIKPVTHDMLSMDWPVRLKRPVYTIIS